MERRGMSGLAEQIKIAEQIKAEAARLGFALCGITSADPPPHHRHYTYWLAEGKAGEMLYLHRQEPKRGDLTQILPNAKSVVCVALNYAPEEGMAPTPGARSDPSPTSWERGEEKRSGKQPSILILTPLPERGRGRSEAPGVGATGTIARYARFDDYHETLWQRLESLLAFIKAQSPNTNGKVYCDTGPITERDLAMRAGLGWIGKHTNLISRQLGNWFFLGEILLDIALPADAPETTHCGTCTRCLPACPTGAITAPYQLDARRCISYLTIELKGSIPEDLRPLVGTRIYGCDDCLAACPWNKFAVKSDDPAVRPRADLTAPDLLELLALDADAFRAKFKNSPIKRTKRRGLLRNVCVALGNLGEPRALPALTRAAETDPEPLVREHAAWAIRQIRATITETPLEGEQE
jgi:epoxyqueuosine reductase